MDERNFTYWLKGFVELQDGDSITDKQWAMIKDHLELVFKKETPRYLQTTVPNDTFIPLNTITC